MKNLKKIILIITVLSMVLVLASCGSSAASVDDASGSYGSLTWNYTKADKTLTISGAGDMNNAPTSEVVGWSAVRLGVEKIVISSSVTTIGDYAFYYMPSLKTITLPANITSIGKYAFAFCTSLENVIIPEGVKTIGESAFEACSSLKTIQLPTTLQSLGAKAFSVCSKLEIVQILGDIPAVGDHTFYYCSALRILKFRPVSEGKVTFAENAFEKSSGADKISYNASEDGSSLLRIEYCYADGTAAADPFEKRVALNESYDIYSQPIEGYTASPITVTGVGDTNDRTEIVTYTKNEVVAAPENNQGTSDTTAAEEDKGLSTGDIIAIVIFVVVIAGIGIAGFLLMRSGKNDGKNTTTVRKNTGDTKNGKNKK